jgi:hypothetical protein
MHLNTFTNLAIGCSLVSLVTAATMHAGEQQPRTSVDPTRHRTGAVVTQDPSADEKAKHPDGLNAAPAGVAVPSPKSIPPRDVLERQFQESLTGATLEGIWQVTGKGGLRSNEPLSKPKTERYSIASATKIDDDNWLIGARIEFGEVDVTVPVPVRVVWAGDTPVITLDDFNVPMIGVYSSRVMFHNGFYSGVWYSNPKNYGGILTGRIVKPDTVAPKDAPQPVPSEATQRDSGDREER